MADTTAESMNQVTAPLQEGAIERTAGGVLALGSLAMVIGGGLHPPSASELGVISETMMRWGVSHWLFAAGAFLVSLAGLLLVLSRSELAAEWYTMASWGGVVLGSLLAVVFLLGEATVLPHLAAAGEPTSFAAWRAFIEMGVIVSLLPVSTGLLLVAWHQARHSSPRTPSWAAWGGFVTFGVGIVWIIGFGFLGVEALGPLFIVEVIGFVWLGWLGVTLARSDDHGRQPDAAVSTTSE